MTLTEIAKRIDTHLKRFAGPTHTAKNAQTGNTWLYFPHVYQGSKYVRVTYVTYQHTTSLERDAAERYLAWLDAGNEGTHYQMDDGLL